MKKIISHNAHNKNNGYKVIHHAAILFVFFVYLVFFAETNKRLSFRAD